MKKLRRSLLRNRGNVTAAARELSVSHATMKVRSASTGWPPPLPLEMLKPAHILIPFGMVRALARLIQPTDLPQ